MSRTRRNFLKATALGAAGLTLAPWLSHAQDKPAVRKPNIILALADDLGWGQVSYNGHPHIKTPNLDAMAASGLRFENFYAAASVRTPTRASFLTGRHPLRCRITGVGQPLPRQERTIGDLAKAAGYQTAFFGKWHLAGGGGGINTTPLPADDPLSPGQFGFDHWLANKSFYDLNAVLGSPNGNVQTKGDSSDVIAAHAIEFMQKSVDAQKPFLILLSYPSPHGGYIPLPEDAAPYAARPDQEARCYGEIAALDRSVGVLRKTLRDMNIADNTLFLFTSDNGGELKEDKDGYRWTNGGLRGAKAMLWEGGVRVPGIIEWPAAIPKARTTRFVASSSDMYPTLSEVLGVEIPDKPKPIDGVSLMPLIAGQMEQRPAPLGFTQSSFIRSDEDLVEAWIDYPWKYSRAKHGKEYLFNLDEDQAETRDLSAANPERLTRMREAQATWKKSCENSSRGGDYR